MSQAKTRGEEASSKPQRSYKLAAELLEEQGFGAVRATKQGRMQFLDGECADGAAVRFWVKQGWSYEPTSTAIRFGMVSGGQAREIPDEAFLERVRHSVDSAKAAGATHLLMVQLGENTLWNWLALSIESLYEAYAEQLAGWPRRARNGHMPVLYFVDERAHLEAAQCVKVVRSRAVMLGSLASGRASSTAIGDDVNAEDGKSHTQREVEVRMLQQRFRQRVGDAFGWRCAVSDCEVTAVLEAAHLPGRNWRDHNRAEDGILLRADLHKLLDSGLARLEEGVFLLDSKLFGSEYRRFHGTLRRKLAPQTSA